jgi:hypothetical protein
MASRQLQAVVGQHVVGSIGILHLDNPIRGLSYNLLLDTVEPKIGHRFAGISVADRPLQPVVWRW